MISVKYKIDSVLVDFKFPVQNSVQRKPTEKEKFFWGCWTNVVINNHLGKMTLAFSHFIIITVAMVGEENVFSVIWLMNWLEMINGSMSDDL